MANKSSFELWGPAPGLKVVSCYFKPAGTGAPTGLTGKGVKSVSRSDVGTFVLNLDASYAALICGTVTLMQAAAGNIVGELAAESVSSSSPNVTIRTVDKSLGAASDIAADNKNQVHVLLVLKDTSAW